MRKEDMKGNTDVKIVISLQEAILKELYRVKDYIHKTKVEEYLLDGINDHAKLCNATIMLDNWLTKDAWYDIANNLDVMCNSDLISKAVSLYEHLYPYTIGAKTNTDGTHEIDGERFRKAFTKEERDTVLNNMIEIIKSLYE